MKVNNISRMGVKELEVKIKRLNAVVLQKIKELDFIDVLLMYTVLEVVSIVFSSLLCDGNNEQRSYLNKMEVEYGRYVFLFVWLPLRALREEVLFRWLPFRSNVNIILMVLASSIYFGYLHGGFEYILIQGFAGIGYSIIYLNLLDKGVLKALLITSFIHFLHNFSVIMIHWD